MATYSYKVSLVGRSGVGKSSAALRIVRDIFSNDQEATIGAAFLTKIIQMEPGDIPSAIQLQIWDTAGQERYHSLIPMYTRGAHIVLLCTDSPSLSDLKHDIKTFKVDDIPATIFIVVTKSDTISDLSMFDELQSYGNDMMYPVHFISSKTCAGIDDLIGAMKLECMRRDPINPRITIPVVHKEAESKCCN